MQIARLKLMPEDNSILNRRMNECLHPINRAFCVCSLWMHSALCIALQKQTKQIADGPCGCLLIKAKVTNTCEANHLFLAGESKSATFFYRIGHRLKLCVLPAACVGDILEFALEYLVGCQTESSKFHHPAKCHLHSILCEQWQWVIPHTKHKTKYSLIEDSTWQQQQQNSTVDARWKRNLMWKKSWSATNAFYTLPATIKQYRWLKHMLNGFSGLEISVSHTHTLCHTVSVCLIQIAALLDVFLCDLSWLLPALARIGVVLHTILTDFEYCRSVRVCDSPKIF